MIDAALRQQGNTMNDIWWKAYEHFRIRLNERYGIDVHFPEYVLLTKERVDKIKITSENKCIGWLKIRGVNVIVCKEMKRNRLLSTVLLPEYVFKLKTDNNDRQGGTRITD